MLLCLCAGVQAVDLPGTAQLLPPETLLFVDIPNFTQLTEQFKKTNYYKLYKDPALAPFVDDLKGKLAEEIKKSEDQLVKAVLGMDALPSGKVAVALLSGPGQGFAKPHVLMIIEWGRAKAKVQETLDKVLAKAAEEGVRKKMEEYRGVNIIAAVHESEPDFVPSYCFIEDCLIGSTNTDLLKRVIARIKGSGGAALGDDGDYTATIKAVGPDHDIDIYVNLKELKEQIITEGPIGRFGSIVTNLGLDNVISLGLAVGVGSEPGSDYSGKALLRVDGEKKGICKMLEFDSTSLRVPKFAPADFHSATFVNFNFKKAFDGLSRIISSLSPQMAAILFMPLLPPSPDGRPGLTIKADIIDHLGSQMLSFESIDKSSKAAVGKWIIALALNNRTALEGSISRLHAVFSQGRADTTRQLLGQTIYLIDLASLLPAFMPQARPTIQGPSQPPPPVLPPLPKLALTLTDTHLILGLEAAVESAIRSLSAGGAEDLPKWFRKARSAVPDTVGLAGFQDDTAAAEVMWEEFKKAAAKKSEISGEDSGRSIKIGVGTSGLSLSQSGVDFINPDLLPDFDAVRKYFGISATYGVAREDGFFFEFKYLSSD